MRITPNQQSEIENQKSIHADSPRAAVETIALLAAMDGDRPVPARAVKRLVTRAVDLFVQIGFDQWGVRRVLQIAEVGAELRRGDVALTDLWRYDRTGSTAEAPVWQQVGELTRRRR